MGRVVRLSGAAVAVFASLTTTRAAWATPEGRSLSAGVDVGFRSARDDLIVPLASSGPSLGFNERFLAALGPGLLDTGIRFQMGALFDRYGHPAASIFHALRLAYLPVALSRPNAWSLALGPALVWETDVLWLRNWDDAHAYWLGRRYLGISARAWRPLAPTWRLELLAELNLVGLESRPPAYRLHNEDALTQVAFYFADVNRAPSLGSVFDWQALRLEADVCRTLSPGFRKQGKSLGLEARLAHTNAPLAAFVFELDVRYAYTWDL
jgi:hypothetical protein